ncbi:HNH endonuclease domain-containing protein [Mucilaginibacter sp. AW1-7]|uniref:HNH endonuclease domain-containing protein n=1 Tax=Mucilaginibacter sp. AW1-7 TaxID=3349874 RepID=UPI003F740537
MDQQTFKHINQILARDNKSSTYKFALLRGTIELIEDNSPFIIIKDSRAHFPLDLLVEKWLLYYYPLVNVPQINNSTQLAFAGLLKVIVSYYELRGGFSAFYRDLKHIPAEIAPTFALLKKKLAATITQMPMKYIGTSIYNKFYCIYEYERGTFSIPVEYYEAFQVLGSFINGTDAILFKWAEFSVQASGKTLTTTQVLNEVLRSPVTERDIAESKSLYKSVLQTDGKVRCVWSGDTINRYDIDHIIPFTIWRNNDLWNLLPARPDLNNQKRDKIPSPTLIENRRELITHYWGLLHMHKPQRFRKELQTALLGYNNTSDWHEPAITQLKNSCDYLITTRGFEGWNG